MRIEEIVPGKTYMGNRQTKRHVVRYGSSEAYVVWADPKMRLPLGGFIKTQCTSTKSFAKWARSEVEG